MIINTLRIVEYICMVDTYHEIAGTYDTYGTAGTYLLIVSHHRMHQF